MDRQSLEKIIREIVERELGTKESFKKNVDTASGILSVRGNTVICEKFDTGNPSDEVYLTDVLTLDESPRLGCGFMEVVGDKPFKWTLEYDEVDYVIDGILEIKVNGNTIRGESGDVIFIPKGSSIEFTTPLDKVRFLYVTYPANWNEQEWFNE